MTEAEILARMNWTREFVAAYVWESNRIDPQPGTNQPGDPVFDWHKEAFFYCVRAAIAGSYALPEIAHQVLLRNHPQAGLWRKTPSAIAFDYNTQIAPHLIQRFLWRWSKNVFRSIEQYRVPEAMILPERKYSRIWDLHCELMNIRPFEIYNGKVGRLLMVNHAILAGIEPWFIPCTRGRETYFDVIRSHPSSAWGTGIARS